MCMFLFEYIMYAFIRFHEYVRNMNMILFFHSVVLFSHGPTNLVIVVVDFFKKKKYACVDQLCSRN